MKPHKHAEAIKAWADGAEIEYRLSPEEEWKYMESPLWWDCNEYRIKPKQPVVRWQCAYKKSDGRWLETEHFYTREEITEAKGYIKLEYTRTEFPE